MLKLFRYLKKYALNIVLIVALLVIQGICDLTLPDYTARIVNIGIQQGGIEHATPDVIRESEMEHLFLMVSTEQTERILSHYTRLVRNELSDTDYDRYVADYPALEQEPVYKLNPIDNETRDELDQIFAKPLVAMLAIESGSEEAAAMVEQMKGAFPPGVLPENAGLFDMLALMPEQQQGEMLSKMDEKFDAMPENMMQQGAVAYIKEEYKAIGIDVDKMQIRYIILAGLSMLGLTLASITAAIIVTLLSSRIAAGFSMELRGRVFDKVVGFSGKELDQFGTASLITRSTNDIQQVQIMMVMMFRMVIYAPILGVYGIIRVLGTEGSMSWILGVGVLVIMALVGVLFSLAMPRFKKLQKVVDKLNLVSREILTGLPVIRAFNNQKQEEKRFDDVNRELTSMNLFVNRLMTVMMPTMMFVMNGITLLIVWVGASRVDAGSMQVGSMMAFIQYTMQVVMAFLMISMVSILWPRASVSANRIAEVLDSISAIQDPDVPAQLPGTTKGLLEFRNVSFTYPGAEEKVLNNISFTARPGETTAIIGSTGCGKSTLVNLIPRFYDVTGGEILIDGVNIKEITQRDLRDRLGFVPQKGVLFSGTIESNIKFGNVDASFEAMKRAARIAQATGFIEEKPDGYRSEISQGGVNVSGGQRQRLSIARAIAKNPEIYVFDDSFSALDFKTDVALRKALKEEIQGSTVIIVAQRISTVLHAEQIIVLDDGLVVGHGTHQELLKTCDVYREIAQSQLSKEELSDE